MTLVRIVIAPTAISPPYLRSDVLKQTEMTLSLACMIKDAAPSAMHGRKNFGRRRIFSFLSRSSVFFPRRNAHTQTHDTPCERMVAKAAPRTPMWNTKMNSGSSTMLQTAPISTVSMPVFAKPCAVMNAFIPSVSWTKIVPMA